jgi:hypothetical protein
MSASVRPALRQVQAEPREPRKERLVADMELIKTWAPEIFADAQHFLAASKWATPAGNSDGTNWICPCDWLLP